jgi:tetratricopeptide (TPR) repeat protein
MSIAVKMFGIEESFGIDSAIAFYRLRKLKNNAFYNFDESELNGLGYKLWSVNKLDAAIRVFEQNVSAYPKSSNAWESLGEAYLQRGDKPLAEKNFKAALDIDPRNDDAIRMLKRMNGS